MSSTKPSLITLNNFRTPSRVKALLDLLITMINSGRTKLVRTVKNTLKLKHYKKVFDWKVWKTRYFYFVSKVFTTV